MKYAKSPGRLGSFKEHCRLKNIQILKDDLIYIDSMLDYFQKPQFKPVLEEYLKKWGEGMGISSKSHQKQNSGRKFANLWLREHAIRRKN